MSKTLVLGSVAVNLSVDILPKQQYHIDKMNCNYMKIISDDSLCA